MTEKERMLAGKQEEGYFADEYIGSCEGQI